MKSPFSMPAVVKPSLFTVPQELQDAIFAAAYPREQGSQWMTRSNWAAREQERHRKPATTVTKHRVQPSPPPLVARFLVSKRFFSAAARAWTRNQEFDICGDVEWRRATGIFNTSPHASIICTYVTHLRCKLWHAKCLKELQTLRILVIEVASYMIECEPKKVAWRDELDDSDFKRSIGQSGIESMQKPSIRAQLRHFECFPLDSHRICTDAEKEMWTKNIRALEAFLRPHIVPLQVDRWGGSGRAYSDTALEPLYPGSWVLCGSQWEQGVYVLWEVTKACIVLLLAGALLVNVADQPRILYHLGQSIQLGKQIAWGCIVIAGR